MKQPIIKINQLSKSYGEKPVIKNISLEVDAGEVLCILGINGAGKTTTINMLLGLCKPSSGSIEINGQNPTSIEVRRIIGSTPQATEFPEFLTAKEIIQLVAAHYPKPFSEREVSEQFNLHDILDSKARSLSGGQKRRLAIALAFIGQPKLVFLDEPTTGLDPESRRKIWQSIQSYVKNGGTVLLTTHYLDEAEHLASRIVVLEDGHFTHEGSVDQIKSQSKEKSVHFKLNTPLPKLKEIQSVQQSNDHYHIRTLDSDALVREIISKNISFTDLRISEDSLETVFIRMSQEASA